MTTQIVEQSHLIIQSQSLHHNVITNSPLLVQSPFLICINYINYVNKGGVLATKRKEN